MKKLKVDSEKKTVEVYNGYDILMETHKYENESDYEKIVFEIFVVGIPRSKK